MQAGIAYKHPMEQNHLTAAIMMCCCRNVSGTRVLTGGKQQTISGITFQDYGCHIAGYPHPYMTAAAAVGGTKQEVDVFVGRLVKCYNELRSKWSRAAAATGGDSQLANHTPT